MAELPEGALMQRAASGLAVAIADLLGGSYAARVLLLVGAGDNGGDALWAGAMLARRGAAVEAVLLSSKVHARRTRRAAGRRRSHGARLGGAPTRRRGGRDRRHRRPARAERRGGRGAGPVRGRARRRRGRARRAWTSTPGGSRTRHVSADLTVDLRDPQGRPPRRPGGAGVRGGAPRRHRARPAGGTRRGVAAGRRRRAAAGARARSSHKYTRGCRRRTRRVADLSRAPRCCARPGAVSGLAGMVRYSGSAADAVRARHPEIVASEGRVQAWVVGSGGDADAEAALADALADGVPTVVDADALMHVAQGPRGLVLTPHAGELARMLDVERAAVEADQLAFARRAAEEYDAVVLLKGRHTLVARPDGRVRVTTSGVSVAGRRRGRRRARRRHRLAARRRPRSVGRSARSVRGCTVLRPPLASGGGPLTATAVADAIPEVVRALPSVNGRMLPMASAPSSTHAEVVVDLGAVRHNVRRVRELVSDGRSGRQLMVVVKADGYGHGMVPVARAARSAGAEWLGVATCAEALALRASGDAGRVLCWLAAPGTDFAPLVEADIDVTASSLRPARGDRARRARGGEPVARVQLKVDTGLSRNGAPRRRVARPWSPPRAPPQDDGRDPGHRPLVALRLLRRARPPGQRARSRRPSRRRCALADGRRARPRGAPPRQLGRGAAPPRRAVRPRPAWASPPTASAPPPTWSAPSSSGWSRR